ncbi:MAG: serine/threonine protein kinase [Planctomycetes bacterium]|nr:serine/threonine protein kinase [Planctomycetota bacterium]
MHCGRPLVSAEQVRFPVRRGDDGRRGPLVGRVVDGKYRVLGVLGRGGMGTVYRAAHEVSHAPVALKVLNPRFAARAEFRQWFLAEARKAGRVVHQNSARVQDVGETQDGLVYLAVEHVDGNTLRQWLEGAPRPTPSFVVEVLEQTARALAAAHDAGVVHRDLSPRNVMVARGDDGLRVKILDFGIATGAPGAEAMRAGGGERPAPAAFANPPYSAPEHLAGEPVDGRADLYSLGVIAYEALSGRAPVDGASVDELVVATLEGRARPLPRLRGVPRALRRLIAALLQRRPDRRPASAQAVAEQLAAIRARASGRGLAIAALSSLLVGGVAYGWVSGPGAEAPFLRTLPGQRGLVVTASPVPDDEPPRALRTEDLLATTFECGGFAARSLTAELVRGGRRVGALPLGAALDADDGTLRFRASAARGVVSALRAASRDGPVDLLFTIDGRAAIAHARVRLDDEAPNLELEIGAGAPAPRLLGDTRLRILVRETDRVAELSLHVELLGEHGAPQQLVVLSLTPPDGDLLTTSARELLRESFGPVRRYGPTRVQLRARDAAGNQAQTAPRTFELLDLGVPEIRSVRSDRGGTVVVERSGGARLSMRLGGTEPGLRFEARAPEHGAFEPLTVVGSSGAGSDVRVDLSLPPRGGARQPSGRWAFRVLDEAGNASEPVHEELQFRTEDPEPSFALPESGGDSTLASAVRVGDGIVLDGSPTELSFACNPLYRPVGFTITQLGGDVAHRGEVAGAAPGLGRLPLPELADGSYQLDVRIEDEVAAETREVAGPPLRVRRSAPRLRLPAEAADAQYLDQLVDCGVLGRSAGRITSGPAWQLEPPDLALLRGRVHFGTGGRLTGHQDLEPAAGVLLAPLALQRGRTEIALEVRDVLGRELDVRVGDLPAPPVVVAETASVAARIARFWYHDRPLSPVEPVVLLEFGQPLTFRLRSEVPLPADPLAVELAVGGGPLHPVTIAAADTAPLLSFRVPYARVAVAIDLDGPGREAFVVGRRAPLRAEVRTPLGTQTIELEVQTIRTALRPVRIGELSADLPAPLRDVCLVPVLGPGFGRAQGDPVPADWPARSALRPAPSVDVRNLADVFVEDSELTRAQYAAIVDAGLATVARGGVDEAQLVHAFDPLGVGRLSAAALRPRDHPDDATFRRAVRAAPEAAVCGLDANQAYCAVRLLGVLVGGDPALFRLPFGVELDNAALGARSDPDPVALNGSAVRGPGILAVAAARFASRPATPPSRAELREVGDVVTTELGYELVGLDGGVREWVADLPFVSDDPDGRALLREWLADHERHAQRMREIAAGRIEAVPSDLLGRLVTYGVVRGAAFGDPTAIPADAGPRLGVTWPGAVRALQVRRDGAGLLPGDVDPHVLQSGLRIAGGQRFVERVRRR